MKRELKARMEVEVKESGKESITFLLSILSGILMFMKNTPSNTHILEIWETEEDKKLSAGDLKHKYFVLARNRFICNPPVVVVNKDTGWPIELSRRVISEWRIKTRTRERILSIQLLDTMIEGAKFLKTVNDAKNIHGIDSVSYFENQCYINDNLYRINITVKKQKSLNRMFAYYYSATETEKK